jgi:hypothetical protein
MSGLLFLRLDNASMLRIYRIDPEIVIQGFHMEGQLEIDGTLTMVGSFLCSDIVYLVHEGCFVLWNWANNTGCKWDSHSISTFYPSAVSCIEISLFTAVISHFVQRFMLASNLSSCIAGVKIFGFGMSPTWYRSPTPMLQTSTWSKIPQSTP